MQIKSETVTCNVPVASEVKARMLECRSQAMKELGNASFSHEYVVKQAVRAFLAAHKIQELSKELATSAIIALGDDMPDDLALALYSSALASGKIVELVMKASQPLLVEAAREVASATGNEVKNN